MYGPPFWPLLGKANVDGSVALSGRLVNVVHLGAGAQVQNKINLVLTMVL